MRCRGMTPSPTPIPSTYRRDSRGPTAWVGDQVDVDIPGTNQRGAANGQRAPVVVFVPLSPLGSVLRGLLLENGTLLY